VTVAAGVLAAGRGTRFGPDKLLAPLGDRPVVRWALDAAMASGLRPVIAVVPVRAAAIEAVLPQGVSTAPARNARKGIAHSLHALLEAYTGWRQVDAVCIGLGDQPRVGPDAYRRLAAAHEQGAELAVATYRGRRANPVLLDRALWPEARRLRGDVGVRAMMGGRDVVEVDCSDTGAPDDVDTPEDLERLTRELER
jgi:CTP:molybdopterin cytidylyltransferase MocA